MGLLERIQEEAKKAGASKGAFFYVREGEEKRIRFLQDMEDGWEVMFHDSYENGVNVPCRKFFGEKCPHCDDENLRHRPMFAWTVWDYEADEPKLFMYRMNSCSPIGALAAMYKVYGTLTDRDYQISVSGKQKDKTYSVVPLEKDKFVKRGAKPFSRSRFEELLKKAYPDQSGSDMDELFDGKTYDGEGTKQKKGKKNEKPAMNPPKEEEEAKETDYSSMKVRELYGLCIAREIEAEPRKKAEYYIKKLEDWDRANADWGEEGEENEEGSGDGWEDELPFN